VATNRNRERAQALLDEIAKLNHRTAECAAELAQLLGEDDFEADAAMALTPPRKLTADEVCAIRSSADSATTLARRYNVSRGTVWSIKAGVSHRSPA